jgi:preprotein translocase subunit SecD
VPKRVDARLTFSVLGLSMAIVLSGCTSGRTPPRSRPSTSPAATAIASAKAESAAVRTTAVLRPVTLDGKSPTGAQLADAAKVLARRFVDAGRPKPTVTVTRDGNLGFSIPATMTADDIAALVARDAVAFRTVLRAAMANAGLRPVAADSSPPGDLASDLAKAKAYVGPAAYALAASLTAPATASDTVRRLARFGQLSPTEVAVLPARMQFNVPTVTCAQLGARDPLFLTDQRFLTRDVTACDGDQPNVKYLLGAAGLSRADLAGATAQYDPVSYAATGGWTIELVFIVTGQRRWTALTAADVDHQIAVLADASVMAAPHIEQAVNGPAVVAGASVTETVAHRVAGLVNAGSLPVEFAVTAVAVSG